MSRRRIIIFSLLAIVVLVAIGLILKGGDDEGIRVYTEAVTARSIQETVAASGKVFPETEVKISSDVSGEIVELMIEEGDSVVAGQLLAKIDPDAFQSQVQRGIATVNSAKAQLANARAQIETLKAQREQTQAQLVNAREIHQRNEGLLKDQVISQADFDASLSNLRALEANLRAAESNVRGAEESARAAQFQVESADASLNELRTSLRRTTIYAPTDGVISLLSVEAGERVVGTIQMSGTEMMRIADLSAMEVRVEVSENDIPRVSLGDKAEIEVDAYLDRKFIGTVSQIANSSTTAATAGAVLNSEQVTNFEVRIQIDPGSYADLEQKGIPSPFRPGMSASVEILTNRVDDALSLPIQAVTTREPEKEKGTARTVSNAGIEDDFLEVVFVVQADTVAQRTVETGIQDNDFIVIKSGVAAGEEVVTGPYNAVARELRDGTKVQVVSEDKFYEGNR